MPLSTAVQPRWAAISIPVLNAAIAPSGSTRVVTGIARSARPIPVNKWLVARADELLPVLYFHVVFTLPHELSALALQNKRVLYELLFRASAETLLEIAADPKHLGAHIDFLAFSTLGDRTYFTIRMFIVSFPPAAWHWTGCHGNEHAGRTFSFLSAYSVVYSAASSGKV